MHCTHSGTPLDCCMHFVPKYAGSLVQNNLVNICEYLFGFTYISFEDSILIIGRVISCIRFWYLLSEGFSSDLYVHGYVQICARLLSWAIGICGFGAA